MEGHTFINNMYSGEMDGKTSEDDNAYMNIEPCDPGHSDKIVEQSNEVSTSYGEGCIKRSTFYMVSALVVVVAVFSGIISIVHLIKSDKLEIPEGYILLPKQYLSTGKDLVRTSRISQNVAPAFQSTGATKESEKSTTSFVGSTNNPTDYTTQEMKASKTPLVTPASESSDGTTSHSETVSENTRETSTLPTRTTEHIPTQPKVAVCPSGWLLHESSCYFLSTQQATWEEAFANCARSGGYLVEISNATEDEFLIGEVKRAKESFWIGLTDRDEEDRWTWMTTKTVVTSNSYTNWGPGQPNNCCGHGEDCVTVASHRSYLWNDELCETLNKYFCEKGLE